MGIKIGFMYLDVTNLGDLVIYETSRYIVEDILRKNKVTDYEIVPISMGSAKCREVTEQKISLLTKLRNKFAAAIKHIVNLGIWRRISPRLGKVMLIKSWHMSNAYQYFAKNEEYKLQGCDIIIFGGGGLVKFHRQNFHFFLNDILKYADENSIPVLINAQGIEGYNEEDLRCQILKEALNRDCVKYISTRDDFAMLRNCYIDNPNIIVKSVCDPAFWTVETYGIRKKVNSKKTVGLNVIRTKIFGEYMYKISDEELGEIYYDLIKLLYRDGYVVDLFSNGVPKDTEFIDFLMTTYPDLKTKYHVTISNPETTKGLVETISGYDRYMAVRLHAAIIGTVLGVPNISLVWNRKQSLFGKEIGMRQNYLKKDKFTARDIYKTLMEANSYNMDELYKQSVYENLEKQIDKWIISRGGNV